MASKTNVDLLDFRTQLEVDIDSILHELSNGTDIPKERELFLGKELQRLEKEEYGYKKIITEGGSFLDLTQSDLALNETPRNKKRSF